METKLARELKQNYYRAIELFGVCSSVWSSLHERFSPTVFCPENRKDFVSEYLFWEELTKDLKDNDIIYYQSIDTFLEEYHDAVYNCLTNID